MSATPPENRTGLNRIWRAFGYSLQGLKAAWQEKAFRQEAIAAFFLIPAALLVGNTWMETALLIGSVILVMVVELLNTGIESAIDRIGPEWHELTQRAKDMGSAAVFLSLTLCIGVWTAAMYAQLFAI